jgi:hypothetical protein
MQVKPLHINNITAIPFESMHSVQWRNHLVIWQAVDDSNPRSLVIFRANDICTTNKIMLFSITRHIRWHNSYIVGCLGGGHGVRPADHPPLAYGYNYLTLNRCLWLSITSSARGPTISRWVVEEVGGSIHLPNCFGVDNALLGKLGLPRGSHVP